MNIHLQKTLILRKSRSADGRTVQALTQTHFKFPNGKQWVTSAIKAEVEIHVRPDAPERRVLKMLEAVAYQNTLSYMDGDDDVNNQNIFNDVWSAPSQDSLSKEDEYKLQEELRMIEIEWEDQHEKFSFDGAAAELGAECACRRSGTAKVPEPV